MSGDFVYENPELTQTRQRRARVVLSCDYCRSKKIKCVKQTNQTKCNACTEFNEPCTFRDRERYHASRDRLYAAQIAPEASASTSEDFVPDSFGSAYTTALGSQGASMAVLSFGPAVGSSSPVVDPLRPSPSGSHSTQTQNAGVHAPDPHFGRALSLNTSTSTDGLAALFSPTNAALPTSTLMPRLIETFFEHYGSIFPFIREACAMGAFLDSTLDACKANCIASLAIPRVTTITEIDGLDLKEASLAYAERAEQTVPGDQACDVRIFILLAHVALHQKSNERFVLYTERAFRCAQQRGLLDETTATDTCLHCGQEITHLAALREHISDLRKRIALGPATVAP